MGSAGLIFVVEDDVKTAASMRLYLEHSGFEVEVFHDPLAALGRMECVEPRAIVLDVMLPKMDGLTFCRTVRERGATPVLIVSALAAEDDRLNGLRIGADDYISKPFSLRELVARVQAVLRRSERVPAGAHGIRLDAAAQIASAGGVELKLTPSEFRILQMFLRSPERVFTREEIIRAALGPDFDGFDRTVDAHIMNLRRKVREAGGPAQVIATVFGTGYRLLPRP